MAMWALIGPLRNRLPRLSQRYQRVVEIRAASPVQVEDQVSYFSFISSFVTFFCLFLLVV